MSAAPTEGTRELRLAALKAAYNGEAIFRSSNASRWIGCPGSVQRIAISPREIRTSSYASEGTAAHIVAQDALTGKRQPEEWTDRMVKIDPSDPTAGGEFVDAEMVEAVQFYVDRVYSHVPDDSCELHIERQLSMAALDPSDPILAENRGTADTLVLNYAARTLTVVDLKYGRGIAVPATSPQPRNYAMNAMLSVKPPDGGWDKIIVEIVQPRSDDEDDRVKTVEYNPNDLMEHMGEFIQAMYRALDDDPPLVVDPKRFGWCHYCPAKVTCPAHAQAVLDAGVDAFKANPLVSNALAPMPAARDPMAYVLPDPSLAAIDDLATWLDSRNVIESWIQAVEQYAVKVINAGGVVPGYKLVPRTGRRAWIDQETAILELRKMGIETDKMYEPPKFKSPAQMEKLLMKKEQFKLEPLVTRSQSSLILTRIEDKRTALPPVFGAVPPEMLNPPSG